MTKEWSELWWVSVGGSDCEPARVVYSPKGPWTAESVPRTIYTIGCADGTIFSPTCGIELVETIANPALTPTQKRERNELWEKQKKAAGRHGYREFPPEQSR